MDWNMEIHQKEGEKRRISTSSQTNYIETERIVIPRPYVNVGFTETPYRLPMLRPDEPKDQEFVKKSRRSPKKINFVTSSAKKNPQYYNLGENLLSGLPAVKDNSGKVKKSIRVYENNYGSGGSRLKKHKVRYQSITNDELFNLYGTKKPKRIVNDYVMHKTFYDIYEELHQRAEKNEKSALWPEGKKFTAL